MPSWHTDFGKGARRETARNPERREIPNGAKSRTARNPKRREIPNSDKQRVMQDGERQRQLQLVLMRDTPVFVGG